MAAERILIVKLSAIGDVIHALPCLNALRQARPEAEIGWLVQEPAAQLLRGHPQLDHLIVYPRKEWGRSPWRFPREIGPFVRQLRSYKFNIALDLQGLTKSGVLARLSGAKLRVGFGDAQSRELNRFFINHRVTPGPERIHVVERYLALLEPLGIDVKTAASVLPIPPEEHAAIDEFIAESGLKEDTRFIALNPGAGWPTKRWAPKSFAELGVRIARELEHPVLLLWGPGEKPLVEEVAEIMRAQDAAPYIAPPTTLPRSAALLTRCAVVAAGDTGPLHLAAALNVPCVGLFAASDAARNRPYVQRSVVLQDNELDCVPCWKKDCPNQPYPDCLRAIAIDDMFQAVQSLIR